MNVTIIGGGFGLYGYLPALIKNNDFRVFLPTRYQEQLTLRKDISCFYNLVQWVNNDENLLKFCQGVIIALPPGQQSLWIKKCLNYKHISHILLEKPVAINPCLAESLIRDLEYSEKKFRVAYNFRFTEWGKHILSYQQGIRSVNWNFKAHHYMHDIKSWKRYHNDGGGALRFYGVHLIALLSELGYTNVSYSKIKTKQTNEAESWHSQFNGTGLSTCTVNISSNSKDTNFIIEDGCKTEYSLLNPFQTKIQPKEKKLDQRIPFIMQSLFDLFHGDQSSLKWYKPTNLLWHNIEQRTYCNEKNFGYYTVF